MEIFSRRLNLRNDGAWTTACGSPAVENPTSLQAHFVTIASYPYYDIVYNAANRVMYTQSNGMYNRGTLTLLVNDDGSPMIWKG